MYQVAVCLRDECAHAGKLSQLLRISPDDMDCLCVNTETVLLRGSHAVKCLEEYALREQSPPGAPFLAYGGRVHTPAAIRFSYEQACALLGAMGMHAQLKGFAYLAWASALAYENEARLFAVGKRLYQPIAERFQTTPQSVERLIRHAVESTMDAAAARGVYGLFGNTLDPARGKPTNAQIIGMLVQRMRVA